MNPVVRQQILHKIQQVIHERVMFAPVIEPAFLNGVGPRLEVHGLNLISWHAYSAPYEDLKLKKRRRAMKRFIARRLGYSLISLFLLSLTIFLLVRVTGDPAVLLVEPGASQADLEAIRTQFGLDEPLYVQYASFVRKLATGDFGQSFYYRTPVLELYLSRLPNSLLLAGVRHGLLTPRGHPHRHRGRRPRQPVVGQRGQGLRAARASACRRSGSACS